MSHLTTLAHGSVEASKTNFHYLIRVFQPKLGKKSRKNCINLIYLENKEKLHKMTVRTQTKKITGNLLHLPLFGNKRLIYF